MNTFEPIEIPTMTYINYHFIHLKVVEVLKNLKTNILMQARRNREEQGDCRPPSPTFPKFDI